MWKILEKKARIKVDRFKQLPPLHKAVWEENISNVRIYLHKKHDVNEQDIYGNTPLHYACKSNNKEIIAILLQCLDIKLHIKDNDGNTPIDLLCTITPVEIYSEDNIDKLGEILKSDDF